jgi:transcriptional regulator with XRE-family HTH domain
MEDNQKGVGPTIRRNRLQQKDVAEALGISRMTVLNWVHGNSTPTGTNLLRLLENLRQFEPSLRAEDLLPEASAEPLAGPSSDPSAA